MWWILTGSVVTLLSSIILYMRLKGDAGKSEKAKAIISKIEKGLTLQTKLQLNLSLKRIGDILDDGDIPMVPKSFNMNIKNEPDQIPAMLDKVKLPKNEDYGVEFAIHDEDKAKRGFFESLFGDILNAFPVKDVNYAFPENRKVVDEEIAIWEENVVQNIYKTFEHTFVGLDEYNIESDEGLSLMAFSGLGCHYTKKLNVAEMLKTDNVLKENKHSLSRAAYSLDLRVLGSFPVRSGFVRYGSCAYFNAKYEAIGIYVCEYNKVFTPNDGSKWEHAKWVFRVTVTTVITIKTHLLQCHEIEADALVTKTREYLPFDHPLRRFLKPFCFRTVFINHSAAKNLIGKKQLVHRTWSYEYSQVNKIMNALHGMYKFELFKDKYFVKEMSDLPDEIYPIATDLKEYWDVTHKFVRNYTRIYYDDETLQKDHFIPRWWKRLNEALRTEYSLNIENMENMLTHLIINGSAWHQYVGNAIQEYLRKPYHCGSKIRPDAVQSDIQSYVQAVTIGILTGLPMPDILNDWKFVLLHDDKMKRTSKVFDEWQSDLKEMSQRVQERNAKRRMPIKFIDPAHLDCSVGI